VKESSLVPVRWSCCKRSRSIAGHRDLVHAGVGGVRIGAAGLPSKVSGYLDDVKHGKPDPEPYLKGAQLLGVPAGECIVIEDAPGRHSRRSKWQEPASWRCAPPQATPNSNKPAPTGC